MISSNKFSSSIADADISSYEHNGIKSREIKPGRHFVWTSPEVRRCRTPSLTCCPPGTYSSLDQLPQSYRRFRHLLLRRYRWRWLQRGWCWCQRNPEKREKMQQQLYKVWTDYFTFFLSFLQPQMQVKTNNMQICRFFHLVPFSTEIWNNSTTD